MGSSNVKQDVVPAAGRNLEPTEIQAPFVPLESLTEQTVCSIISVITSYTGSSPDYSERTLLIFLIAINNKLKEIENSTNETEQTSNENIIQHAKKVREWLVDSNKQPLNWIQLKDLLDRMNSDTRHSLASLYQVSNPCSYFELTMNTKFKDVQRSRDYINMSRKEGFLAEELKLYWNSNQLENLCQQEGELSDDKLPSYDPSDVDAVKNLREYPVYNRNHRVKIEYINKGIEKAVFDVPEDSQIIVLNFANELSPGGGYLRHAIAQEEVILYNSDGYRALLDLKYKRMAGGYAIPEFGVAYVRNMQFYDSKDSKKTRRTDMLVSACYCLHGSQLYATPKPRQQLRDNTIAKFRAFMCAAVANTIGDGNNTYLLLGPIGTGAFGNDTEDIGECFRDVLKMPMMKSKGPIHNAFGNIWFVSIDKGKNETFEKIFSGMQSEDV